MQQQLASMPHSRLAYRLGDDGFYIAHNRAAIDSLDDFYWNLAGFVRAGQKALDWLNGLSLQEAEYFAAFYTSTADTARGGEWNGFRALYDQSHSTIRAIRVLPARVET